MLSLERKDYPGRLGVLASSRRVDAHKDVRHRSAERLVLAQRKVHLVFVEYIRALAVRHALEFARPGVRVIGIDHAHNLGLAPVGLVDQRAHEPVFARTLAATGIGLGHHGDRVPALVLGRREQLKHVAARRRRREEPQHAPVGHGHGQDDVKVAGVGHEMCLVHHDDVGLQAARRLGIVGRGHQ